MLVQGARNVTQGLGVLRLKSELFAEAPSFDKEIYGMDDFRRVIRCRAGGPGGRLEICK